MFTPKENNPIGKKKSAHVVGTGQVHTKYIGNTEGSRRLHSKQNIQLNVTEVYSTETL